MHLAHQLRRKVIGMRPDSMEAKMQKVPLEVIRKMIRIMTADKPTLTMITVDGQLAGADLDDKFRKLEQEDEIERLLGEIKARRGKTA